MSGKGLPSTPVSLVKADAAKPPRVDTVHSAKGETLDAVLYVVTKARLDGMLAGTKTEIGRIGHQRMKLVQSSPPRPGSTQMKPIAGNLVTAQLNQRLLQRLRLNLREKTRVAWIYLCYPLVTPPGPGAEALVSEAASRPLRG